ncbi:MAG: phage minor capsid protein [Huintestinicola sp.]
MARYNEAIYSAVKELTDKGITRVTYPSGRHDNVDVCVRRAVLSSVNKSCCDIQLDLANEVGSRYVEVSAHFGARPSHAEWQGQIYSLVKGDPKYPYFYEATGYGTGDGLGGWNCRHNFFPYFDGIDTPYHTPEFSKTENNEYYALTQKQRAYERAVRDSKRQLAALDGARQAAEDPALRAKLDSDFARRSVTLKNREERLDSFIRDNNLQRDNSRVRVAGFGKSVSQKAVWAERKFYPPNGLTSGGGNGKMNDSGDEFYPVSPDAYDKIENLGVFGDERDKIIQDAMKHVLDNVIDKEPGTESLALYYQNNINFIKEIDSNNSDGSINTLDADSPYISIHNHASGKTFSASDIAKLQYFNNLQGIFVVGNNGNSYGLVKTDKYNSLALYELLMKKKLQFIELSDEDFVKECEKCGLKYYRRAD